MKRKSKSELLAHYATREPTKFAQIDGFIDGFDSVVTPNEHGVAIMGTETYELMSGVADVRILIKPGTDPAKVITVLTDAADWVKRGAIEQILNPPRFASKEWTSEIDEDLPF